MKFSTFKFRSVKILIGLLVLFKGDSAHVIFTVKCVSTIGGKIVTSCVTIQHVDFVGNVFLSNIQKFRLRC